MTEHHESFSSTAESGKIIEKLTVEAVEAKKEFAYEKAKRIYLMLKTAVEQSYGVGHELLEIYLDLIDIYLNLEEYQEAGLAIEEAESIATDMRDRLEVLRRKTKHIFALRNYEEAIHTANMALEMAEYPFGDYERYGGLAAHFMGDIGKAYIFRDRMACARVFAEEALKIANAADDPYQQARSMNILGYAINYGDRDLYGAIDIWKKAVEFAKKGENPEAVGNLYHGIGTVYRELRDGERAREYLKKALDVLESIGNMEGVAMELKAIADSYTTEERYEEALEYYSRARDIYIMLNDHGNLGTLLIGVGIAQMEMGLLEEAYLTFQDVKTQSVLYNMGVDDVYRDVLINLSSLYERMGRYEKERECAEEALALGEMYERDRGALDAAARLALARVQIHEGKGEEALEKLRAAVEGFKREPYFLPLLGETYAWMYVLTGEEEHLKEAVECFRDAGARKSFQRLKDAGLIPESEEL